MINLFMKGFFIGLGKIIPGVSGSVMAISFGIYDRVLDIISHPFKKIKDNISFILPIMLGFILAVVSSSNILYYLINKYYIIMMLLFIGLIIGGIPKLFKEFKFSISNTIILIISFLFIILLSLVKQNEKSISFSSLSFIFIGLIEAITTIVPGISGTAIMMLIGCYNSVLEMFSNIFLISNLKYFIPFLIGVLIGVIIISKIITYLLKKYKEKVFSSILGFMLASTFVLIVQMVPNISNILEIIIGLILMFIGIKLSHVLS